MIRRLLAVLHARNIEFLRDRSTLGWNVLLPILLIIGLGVIFGGPERPLFKVGVITAAQVPDQAMHRFLETDFIEFVPVSDPPSGQRKVGRHQLDLLVDFSPPRRYWVNEQAPKSYVVEKLLLEAGAQDFERVAVTGAAVGYVDWLLPGILGMNMMFSCLFGVGYVVVRYRKSGFLKRLRATPLAAIEFIAAQVLSRLILIITVTALVYTVLALVLELRMEGSYLLLLAIAILGAASMIALSLLVAARVTSEELAGGVLNMISWPMMLLSGVWFSLEGVAPWIAMLAKMLPLTLMLDAARAVMLDGAGLLAVVPQLVALAGMTGVFLVLGAVLFRWRVD